MNRLIFWTFFLNHSERDAPVLAVVVVAVFVAAAASVQDLYQKQGVLIIYFIIPLTITYIIRLVLGEQDSP